MQIATLVSGGVDSSVALKLLKEQGHKVTAFYLKIWLEDELASLGQCPWEEDLSYVRQICKKEKIPLKIVPLQKEYWKKVVAYTISEVKKGRTPNPDVLCNSQIKFKAFVDKIDKSFDKIATGHYAQILEKKGIFYLKKSPDPIKDQTYFLAGLSQKQLKRIIFPIGHLLKDKVRKLAKKYDLPNKDRKDSQGICFLGKLKYDDFLKHHLGVKKGKILEYETNQKLGEHEGYYYYTLGQRKGIKLSGGPWYVVKKDIKKNIIYVSKHYHDKNKARDTFEVGEFNWFEGRAPKKQNLSMKLRHGEKIYRCAIKFLNKKSVRVKIKGRDQGIAPGQFAVFYDKNICLGSAVIQKS